MLLGILGSAAGGGFPQWNCGCDNCDGIRAGTIAAAARTQASACVTANGRDYVLINASPDIHVQIARTDTLRPRSRRHSPIAAVVLTNGDLDHCLGLLSLREAHPFAIYATPSVRRSLTERNVLFRTLARSSDQVVWRDLRLGTDTTMTTVGGEPLGLRVGAFAAPGKVPLHLEGLVSAEKDQNVGILVREEPGTATVAYAPSVGTITATLRSAMHGADALLFDGTFWSQDELIRLGIGTRSANDMAHIPMSGARGSLALLADVRAPRRFFTHINNTNPVLRDDAPERQQVLAAGWGLAYDGMELKL